MATKVSIREFKAGMSFKHLQVLNEKWKNVRFSSTRYSLFHFSLLMYYVRNVSWAQSEFLAFLQCQMINNQTYSKPNQKPCSCVKPYNIALHSPPMDTRSSHSTCNAITIHSKEENSPNKGCKDYNLNTMLLVERNESRVLNVQNCVELDKQIPCRLC